MKFLILIFTIKKIPVVSWSSYDALNLKPKFITLLYLILGLFIPMVAAMMVQGEVNKLYQQDNSQDNKSDNN